MDISVIIVSYNVRYFLESCLLSVFRAMQPLEGEVIVVDNNSVDGSVAMVKSRFPQVHLIENRTNTGFAKANNLGLSVAQGRTLLLLNPDTLIEENTLIKSIAFMDEHPEAGAMGVKMIDGKGKFLPESKRALPTPGVAFFKIFGLSRLFPGSGKFNRYALGHLNPDQTHEVDVLSGAFMFIRREVLEKTGGLDETFFMYGEDIDLSYRIQKAGYKNYYFAGTTIVHYKGESTKKGSLNYVLLFYQAMLTFAEKHFTRPRSKWLGFVIRPAIYFRAFLSILRRLMLRFVYPVMDVVLFFLGYLILMPVWEKIHFEGNYAYPDVFRYIMIPLYILVWMAGIGLSGGYTRPVRLWSVVRGIVVATVTILILYALLPLTLRFSRILILAGASWALFSGVLYRILLSFLPWTELRLYKTHEKNVIIAGNEKEYYRILSFLNKLPFEIHVAGFVSREDNPTNEWALGTFEELKDIIRIHDIQEVIFSATEVSPEKIIGIMTKLEAMPVSFRIALPESSFILGSDSVRSAGELYLVGMNSVTITENRIRKRILDIFLSIFFVLTFPLLFFSVRKPGHFMRNCFFVLSGRRTWVGFCNTDDHGSKEGIPQLTPGIICPAKPEHENDGEHREDIHRINLAYARNYHPWKDIRIILNRFAELGG